MLAVASIASVATQNHQYLVFKAPAFLLRAPEIGEMRANDSTDRIHDKKVRVYWPTRGFA